MFAPEQSSLAILAAFCRRDLEGHKASPEEVQSVSDWPALLDCAFEHGLTGLLFRSIPPSHLQLIPAWKDLRADLQEKSARNCLLAAELTAILSTLKELGTDAMFLKGPALSAWLYGSVSCRDYSDLDILVRSADLAAAHHVLYRRGYRPHVPYQANSTQTQNDLLYVHGGNNIHVELHWALHPRTDRTPLERTGCWERGQLVSLWGHQVQTLSSEDTLLYLCCHGMKHCWGRLKWIADIAWLLRSEDTLNWNAVLMRARSVGCVRRLCIGVGLANVLLGAPIPSALASRYKSDRKAVRIVHEICQDLFNDREVDALRSWTLRIGSCERRSDVLAFALRLLGRMFRLSPADAPGPDARWWMRVTAVLKRPWRLYKMYGFQWAVPLMPWLSSRTAPQNRNTVA